MHFDFYTAQLKLVMDHLYLVPQYSSAFYRSQTMSCSHLNGGRRYDAYEEDDDSDNVPGGSRLRSQPALAQYI